MWSWGSQETGAHTQQRSSRETTFPHLPPCTAKQTTEALLCAHSPHTHVRRASTDDHSQGPRSAGSSYIHHLFSWRLTKPLGGRKRSGPPLTCSPDQHQDTHILSLCLGANWAIHPFLPYLMLFLWGPADVLSTLPLNMVKNLAQAKVSLLSFRPRRLEALKNSASSKGQPPADAQPHP